MYNGKPGYDLGDLFREHAVKKGYFSVVGRSGDQIMLSTGEMVYFLLLFRQDTHLYYVQVDPTVIGEIIWT